MASIIKPHCSDRFSRWPYVKPGETIVTKTPDKPLIHECREMLLSVEDLKKWLGYERTADVVSWLDRNRVPYRTGKNREPCTTLDALTHALEGSQESRPARFG